MSNSEKALKFACHAHLGQVRKSEKEKPIIVHPINVANILREYGFDDNVISAGYLHDVVEDTKYTLEDILKEFGEDIYNLVKGVTEPDKSLSWEERKQHTIDTIPTLSLRGKALACADKISNLEDLYILSEIKGYYDFSKFKRGYKEWKWYYTSLYEAFTKDGENHPMFDRLKYLIDVIFYNFKDNHVKELNNIFDSDDSIYINLRRIHFKKLELKKLSTICHVNPYVIEFLGTPRTGKTTIINNVKEFFENAGFKVYVIDEFTTTSKCKKEIYTKYSGNSQKIHERIMYNVQKNIDKVLNLQDKPDIILIDRGIADRLVWMERASRNGVISQNYASRFLKKHLARINSDLTIVTNVSSKEAVRRGYINLLALEEKMFLNEKNIEEYNRALKDLLQVIAGANNKIFTFNTTSFELRDIQIQIADKILNAMKSEYLSQINSETNILSKTV